MCSRWRGSIPLNGSSSSSTGGSWTRRPAILTRCRIPFEYVPIGRSAASVELDRRDRPGGRLGGVRRALEPGVEQHELAAGEER